MPLVLLEVMQYKKAIVTTDEGGIPDIVKDGINGFICKREDAISLANSIEKLISDKNTCIEFGKNGYEIFKTNFTINRFNENFKTIITNTLNNL